MNKVEMFILLKGIYEVIESQHSGDEGWCMPVILTPRKEDCRCEDNLDYSETLSKKEKRTQGYAASRLFPHKWGKADFLSPLFYF